MVRTDDPGLAQYKLCGAVAVTNTKDAIRAPLCHDGADSTGLDDNTDWDDVVTHATGDAIGVDVGEKKATVSRTMLGFATKCFATASTTNKTAAEAKFCIQEALLTQPDVQETIAPAKSCVSTQITTDADALKSLFCMAGEPEVSLAKVTPQMSSMIKAIKKCSALVSSNPSFANFDALEFVSCFKV
jgi:hypothetical protein